MSGQSRETGYWEAGEQDWSADAAVAAGAGMVAVGEGELIVLERPLGAAVAANAAPIEAS